MAQLKDHFQEFISDPVRRRIYEREALAFDAAELVSELMEEEDVSKAKLAERVGTSKSHVTSLLSGSRNMTLHTLADLAFVLGHKVEIKSAPLSTANWLEFEANGFPASEWSMQPSPGSGSGMHYDDPQSGVVIEDYAAELVA